MQKSAIKVFVVFSFLFLLSLGFIGVPAEARSHQQQATSAIATVTGTPTGVIVRVTNEYEQINVRSGPGVANDAVGVLIAGEEVTALGRTVSGEWIQIAYPGVESGVAWVYSPLVSIIGGGGTLPIVAPPPTSTPRVTPTINPTLASQYIYDSPSTRMPTFTAPAPLFIPTYPVSTGLGETAASFPMGIVILLLGVLSIILTLIAVIRGR